MDPDKIAAELASFMFRWETEDADEAAHAKKIAAALRAYSDYRNAECAGAMEAQDKRERDAAVKCGMDYYLSGCDWPDDAADEILTLRAERNACAAAVLEMRERAAKVAAEYTTDWSYQRAPAEIAAEIRALPLRKEGHEPGSQTPAAP